MHPSIQIFDDAIREFIHTDFDLEVLADDCSFTEGPLWNKDGFYLFSDITANTVYKLIPGKKKEVFIASSGTANINDDNLKQDQAGSNGLAYDNEGTLLFCRHGSHMIAKWKEQQVEPFITTYRGEPSNSPNDIIVDRNGRIFFSYLPYGLKDSKPAPDKFQPLAGVYFYEKGDVRLICEKYQYPNGVCITPDGQSPYICSNKPFEKFISVYDLDSLSFQTTLAEENSDGIKCDPFGNVYLSNKDGLLILAPSGKKAALIQLPTVPANHCFGGEGNTDLFITGREKVYRIKNLVRGR